MAKSQTQRSREHVARLRRKAQAFDKLLIRLETILPALKDATDANLVGALLSTAHQETKLENGGA